MEREVKVFGLGKVWNGRFQYNGNYGADMFTKALADTGHVVTRGETSATYFIAWDGKIVGYYEWA